MEDEDFQPGDEFVLCINERTGQEAYIEVCEFALYDKLKVSHEKIAAVVEPAKDLPFTHTEAPERTK